MLPNFMIFSPGTLEPFESTRLTSLSYQTRQRIRQRSAAFRQVTLLSWMILNRVEDSRSRSQAVSGSYFVLIGGVLVLAANIQTSLPERRKSLQFFEVWVDPIACCRNHNGLNSDTGIDEWFIGGGWY